MFSEAARRCFVATAVTAAVLATLSYRNGADASDRILFVSPAGVDAANRCASASKPCATIAHALREAANGDVIEAGAGRYMESSLTVTHSVTIEGAGSGTTVIDASGNAQALLVASDATLTLTDLAVVDGKSPAHAGAIENSGTLTLIDDLISRNRAADPGGAIVNYGTITSMVGDRFVDNNSARYGGAIENFGTISVASHDSFTGNFADIGSGAIDNQGVITELDYSSFTSNKAGYAGAVDNSGTIGDLSEDTFWDNLVNGYGGALVNVLATIDNVTNDTFAYNVANDGLSLGGAIEQDDATIGTLENDTIIDNQAAIGGGIDDENSTVGAMGGVVLAANDAKQGTNCYRFQDNIVDSGYNLESDKSGSCGFTDRDHDLIGVNPALRTLADYGGPTLSAAPTGSSPTVTDGEPGPCAVTVDQRGVPRPQTDTGVCDIGSVQWASPAPTGLAPSSGPISGETHVSISGSGFTLSSRCDLRRCAGQILGSQRRRPHRGRPARTRKRRRTSDQPRWPICGALEVHV